MDWPNERYARLYIRDTADWLSWPWQSRALFPLLLRKADRTGTIAMGRRGRRGLAVLTGLPDAVVSDGLDGLLEDGCVQERPGYLVMPNFIEAQECGASPAERQRAARERNRDNILKSQDIESRPVTDGHESSRTVTPSRAVPFLAVPSEPKERLLSADADPGSSFGLSNEEPKQEDPNPVVQRVFEHWRTTLGHPAAKLDRKRRQAITSALALGYTEEQLTIAIAGCASSPWHLGKNDRKTRYDALTLILRDAEQIDKFIGLRMTPDQQRQVFGGSG
jgi:hypothetical protein